MTTILHNDNTLTLEGIKQLSLLAESYKAIIAELCSAMSRLRLEAIHFRNTGVGKQFLNAAIDDAESVLLKFSITRATLAEGGEE